MVLLLVICSISPMVWFLKCGGTLRLIVLRRHQDVYKLMLLPLLLFSRLRLGLLLVRCLLHAHAPRPNQHPYLPTLAIRSPTQPLTNAHANVPQPSPPPPFTPSFSCHLPSHQPYAMYGSEFNPHELIHFADLSERHTLAATFSAISYLCQPYLSLPCPSFLLSRFPPLSLSLPLHPRFPSSLASLVLYPLPHLLFTVPFNPPPPPLTWRSPPAVVRLQGFGNLPMLVHTVGHRHLHLCYCDRTPGPRGLPF